MNKIESIDKRQSVVMDAIRFPLIVLVVLIHIPSQHYKTNLIFSQIDWNEYIQSLISHTIGGIAVPIFFIISGYFFFFKMKEWNIQFYRTQLKKRVSTLLIPYVLWIIGVLAIDLFIRYSLNSLNMGYRDVFEVFHKNSLYSIFIGIPINLPLWYLRDLICMVILSPLFFFLFKHTKFYGLILLYIFYFSGFQKSLDGFSSTAFFYFGVGSYLGIYKKNILEIALRFKKLSIVLAILLPILIAYMNSSPYRHQLLCLYIPIGTIAAFNVMDVLIRNAKLRSLLIKLSPTVFFIYAAHWVHIMNYVKGGVYGIFDENPDTIVKISSYFLISFITVIICILLYYIMKKITPRTLSLLTGGRI